MFKSFNITASFAVLLLASGCASVPMASLQADTTAKSYSVTPGNANLYIYRNETLGAASKIPVLLDNSPIGETASMTYIFRQVSPGEHVIASRGSSTLTIDAKAGGSYFVWQEIRFGRTELHIVDEAKGKAGVSACKLIE